MHLDIEKIFQLSQFIRSAPPTIGAEMAGFRLRSSELELTENLKLTVVERIDTNDQIVWSISARWDRDHDQHLMAFISGDMDAFKRDWIVLLLLEKQWKYKPALAPDGLPHSSFLRFFDPKYGTG